MKGKDSIINSILENARLSAEQIKSTAEGQARNIVEMANSSVAQQTEQVTEKFRQGEEDFLARRMSVAALEVKKYKLLLKQQAITKTFDLALEKLFNLPQKEYEKLMASLLSNSQKGEEVVVCARDQKIITQEFLNTHAKGKNLTLAKTAGDFCGGIVLQKEGYDKDLTLETLLGQSKNQLEGQVLKTLFEEK